MAGVDLNYRWDGREGASVLVLSHAIGTSMALWEPQVAPLAQRFRVLRYDHRGHGGSPVPQGPYAIADLARDLIQLLDHLGLERVSFCGLSLGGMVGMWLAVNAPERIDRLILCCTTPRMLRPDDYAARAVRVRNEGLEAIADMVLSRWFSPAFATENPKTVGSIRRLFLATNPEGYAATCEALAAMDQRADLPRIAAPTLVIAGGVDLATPVEQAEQIVGAIKDARLTVLDSAAHLANLEQPETMTTLIADELSRR